MDIEVTHPAWIEHIQAGDTKDSADFDPCGRYDDCEPIEPTDPNENLFHLMIYTRRYPFGK